MLITFLRQPFRFRKQFEDILMSGIHTVDDFKLKFSKLEGQLSTPEDYTLFRYNLMKNKNKFYRLGENPQQQWSNHGQSIDSSITAELIYRIHNNKLEKQVIEAMSNKDAQMIHRMTLQMLQYQDVYLWMLRNYSKNAHFIGQIRRRLFFTQKFLSDLLFQGYKQFKATSTVQNPFEIKKTKFKQDFQFKIIDMSPQLIDLVADMLYVMASFNSGSDKMYLLAELILLKYVSDMSDQTVGKYLFSLAQAKKAVLAIEDAIMREEAENPINFMYYMLVNKIDSFQQWQKMISNLKNCDLSKIDKLFLRSLLLSASKTDNLQALAPAINDISQKVIRGAQEHVATSSELQVFQSFLKRKRYIYTVEQEQFLGGRLYRFQNLLVVFLHMDMFIMRDRQIGRVALMKEWYHKQNSSLKVVAAHHLVDLETRREADQYFYSKMKGCERDTSEKPLKFDF